MSHTSLDIQRTQTSLVGGASEAPCVTLSNPSLSIQPVSESLLPVLFAYLNDHLLDNGSRETGYFRPRPQKESSLAPQQEQAFRHGASVPVGKPGWRRAWVARTVDGAIAGHVDLWAHPEPYAEHRCLLGMGVHRQYRRRGLGAVLLDYAVSWAKSQTSLEWVDLHVLSTNAAALRLYLLAGFVKIGEVPEMFKFDGQCLSDVIMTRRISRQTSAQV